MKPSAKFFAALLVSLALIGLVPGTAFAVIPSILDKAGVLNADQIRAAAAKVDKVGIVVVTMNSTSTDVKGDLQALGAAAGWQGNGWTPQSVILAVNIGSRQLGLFYGGDTPSSIASNSGNIQDKMAAAFSGGDWTAGMVAGIDAVQSATKTSYTWLWFLLILAVAIVAFVIYRRVKGRKAAAAAKKAQEILIAQNQLAAEELRQRVDELVVLVQTLPAGAARQQVQADLSDVDVVLKRRDQSSEGDLIPDNVSPEQDDKNLESLADALAQVATRCALLRQDPGWEDMWQAEISAARASADRLGHGQQLLSGTDGFVPIDTAALEAQVNVLSEPVGSGTLSVSDGLTALQQVLDELGAKQSEVDGKLAAIDDERRRQEAQTEREEEERRRNSGGGNRRGGSGFGGGMMTGWIIGSATRGRRGGGWGGGGFGGGGGGSRGFGGGGGGGGFGGGGGGGGGGGSSRGF